MKFSVPGAAWTWISVGQVTLVGLASAGAAARAAATIAAMIAPVVLDSIG
jgi:hypothetical protein